MLNKRSSGQTSHSSLLAVIISIIAAFFILLVFILPAEFGKDITGLGAKIGVQNMSTDTAEDSAEIESATPSNSLLANVVDNSEDPDKIESPEHAMFATPIKFMETEVVLAGNDHAEFKFELQKGSQVNYLWYVEGSSLVYSDLHGHNPGSTDSEDDDELVSYLDSQQDNSLSGQFIAPLSGDHGWYFLNLEEQEVRIKIQASGHWDGYEFYPLDNY
ncbi:MAG: hypothetical protein KTR16_16720 [Acidiferrobacterales bacterium]|nr:hypothetical protein [Acidiferrobacterales bacterium]